MAGFSRAWTTGRPSSHKLAEQIYFPVADGYHLFMPTVSSSLAQAMYEKLTAERFSEESKAIRDARKAGKWHSSQISGFLILPKCILAAQNTENISLLNSVRGGRVWLLPSMPPTGDRWIARHKTCAVFFLTRRFQSERLRGIVAR